MQIEGAWNISKGPTVWDTWLHSSSAIKSFGNADTTANHYYKYKEDLDILNSLSANVYRFSFSWARILPNCSGKVNEDGIRYYTDMIDRLKANGIVPVGTLFHWDLPQSCYDQYGGWVDSKIVNDFVNYADVLFTRFSDKITHWLTLNEPSNYCIYSYDNGYFPPNVKNGMAGRYLCAHYSILATAYVSELAAYHYPKLKISYPLVMSYGEPLDPNKKADVDASQRYHEFAGSWFLDPFFTGDYPASMRSDPRISKYLPPFSPRDKEALSQKLAFIGLNYYTSTFVYYDPTQPGDFATTNTRNGIDIGPRSGIEWQYMYPDGLKKLLLWISNRYPKVSLWITELGVAGLNENIQPMDQVIQDDFRIEFIDSHLNATMESNVKVDVILFWSLLGNLDLFYFNFFR